MSRNSSFKFRKTNLVDILSNVKRREKCCSEFIEAYNNVIVTDFIDSCTLSQDQKIGLLVIRFGLQSVNSALRAFDGRQVAPTIISEGLELPVELCSLVSKLYHDSRSSSSSSTTTTTTGSTAASTSSSSTSCASSCIPSASSPSHLFIPPSSNCCICFGSLHRDHPPVSVKYFTLNGPTSGKKINLRCRKCKISYKYDVYGSAQSSWTLYDEEREAVVITDCVFMERKLFELHCNFANHSWVSFSGFSESYNGTFQLTRHTGLSAKNVSSAFFNGELENEMRERGNLDMFHMVKVDSDKDQVLAEVEKLRRKEPYEHHNCHANCKAKGCGRVFAIDGIWKLRFPHCMFKVKSASSKVPIPGLPDVCTNPPVRGKAFCSSHCEAVEKTNTPSGLHEFLEHCRVSGTHSTVADAVDDQTPRTGIAAIGGENPEEECSNVRSSVEYCSDDLSEIAVKDSTFNAVEAVLSKLEPSSGGTSVIEAQGTAQFVDDNCKQMSTIMANCEEDNPTSCKKDVGRKKCVQKWSRGHLFIVRAGGHIEYWQSLFVSESPSQVFLIMLAWLAIHLRAIPPNQWSSLALVYDNMCHLDNMRVAQKPLPLAWPWSHMWLYPHKCIDRLHFRNHVDAHCKATYNPDSHLQDTDNTQSCEQTFVWLGRFKKIVCAMSKAHHLFFIHRMVVRRNRYTAFCYFQGYEPVLPVVKSVRTT